MERRIWVTEVAALAFCRSDASFFAAAGAFPFVYVDQGAVEISTGGKPWVLQQGEVMVFPAGRSLRIRCQDQGAYLYLAFHAVGEELDALPGKKYTASHGAVSSLRALLKEHMAQDAYAPEIVGLYLELSLLELLRAAQTPTGKLKTPYALHSENEVIRRAQIYVDAHVTQKLSVPQVARRVDVSPSYLTALFHKHLQISPGEFIRQAKLQKSAQLIREGKMNFTEIAAALHYSTVQHFSRQFKAHFGMTPTQYAKSIE